MPPLTGGASSLLSARIRAYLRLIRFHRPIGTLLLLWPTLWALWLAGDGHPDPKVLVIFVAGVFLMRSAGCAINDFADRNIDPHVARTRDRPLATREITALEALAVSATLALIAFILVLQLNTLTILLSLVGGVMAASYPFLKRFTSLPQFYLGAAFGWSVPMSFAAETGGVPVTGWLMFAAVVLWAVAYDTMYAMVDRDDDLRIGVRSTAILFGRWDRLAVATAHLGALLLLAATGLIEGLGTWYFTGLVAAAALAMRQQALIRNRLPDDCFRAFLDNNIFGMVIFLGLVLHFAFAGV
jgi:4-hydroxybenzoate polyprenyltransferase